MMMFLLLGLAAAFCVVLLVPAMKNRKQGIVFATVLPALALVLYSVFGHPDLPSSHIRAQPKDAARFQIMQLAEKPVLRLEQTGGRDMSALAVMGDLNLRLGNEKGAREFYSRALAVAEKEDDPRAEIYRDKIRRLR